MVWMLFMSLIQHYKSTEGNIIGGTQSVDVAVSAEYFHVLYEKHEPSSPISS